MPAATKKYQQKAMGDQRRKRTKSHYIDKDSQKVHLSWALKEAKDFDKWRWNGKETNPDNELSKNKVTK